MTDEDLLKDIRQYFDYDTRQWEHIRNEATIDMRYVAGDPWDATDKKLRKDSGRPFLALDELGQYVNQLINDVRQNKRAIKVTPMGNGATDQSADLRANLIRQIEYRSNAQQAYTTMFENAVQRSYGYLRIKATYVSPKSRHQELLIEPIVNPDLVTIDADAVKPDGSDMTRAFIHEWWDKDTFSKQFPDARATDFSTSQFTTAGQWIKDERILLTEYWCVETTKKTLVYLDVPSPTGVQQFNLYDDELATKKPQGAVVVGSRKVDVPTVQSYLTNGFEILEKNEPWKGQFIPLVCCFGKVIYVDDGMGAKRKMLSAIRLARDPYMLYCYYRTCEAELVGMTPKFPYFVYEGQLSPEELLNLQKSLHEPIAVIRVRATIEGLPANQVLAFPQRQPYEPPLQGLEAGAEGARRAIQAAMGISPLPTSAQRRNEKSGKALQVMRESEQQGTFHFIDHYEDAITRTGTILNDLIPHYYDAARDIAVRKPDDTTQTIRINDPQARNPETNLPYLMTEGEHDVTLSTGPSFDSEREASNDFADAMVQNIAQVAQIAGPEAAKQLFGLSIRLKNLGPLGTEMADIISPKDPGQQQIAQLKQQVGQATKVIQELTAHVNKLSEDAKAKTIENQTKLTIADKDNQTRIQIAQIQAQATLAAAEIKAQIADMDRAIKALEAMVGVKMAEVDAERETRLAHHQTAHEAATMVAEHGHAHRMAQAEHDRALELASVSHDQALEQNQQAADLTPTPQTES